MLIDIQYLLQATNTTEFDQFFAKGFEKAQQLPVDKLSCEDIVLLGKISFIQSSNIRNALFDSETFELEGPANDNVAKFLGDLLKKTVGVNDVTTVNHGEQLSEAFANLKKDAKFSANIKKLYDFAEKDPENGKNFNGLSDQKILEKHKQFKFDRLVINYTEQLCSLHYATNLTYKVDSISTSLLTQFGRGVISLENLLYCYCLMRRQYVEAVDQSWSVNSADIKCSKFRAIEFNTQLEVLENYLNLHLAQLLVTSNPDAPGNLSKEEQAAIKNLIAERMLYAKTHEAVIDLYANVSDSDKKAIAAGMQSSVENATPTAAKSDVKSLSASTVELFNCVRSQVLSPVKTTEVLQKCGKDIQKIAERPCLSSNAKIKNLLLVISSLFLGAGLIYLAATMVKRGSFWLKDKPLAKVAAARELAGKFSDTTPQTQPISQPA